MTASMIINLGKKPYRGFKGWLGLREPVGMSWKEMRRHLRIYRGDNNHEDGTLQVLLLMIDSVIKENGRVVIVDPSLGSSAEPMVDGKLWRGIIDQYPCMRTITALHELSIISDLLDRVDLDAADRIVYVGRLQEGVSTDSIKATENPARASEVFHELHRLAGMRLGVTLEGGGESVSLGPDRHIPVLVVTTNVDTRTRASGLYHGHYRGANISIVNIKDHTERDDVGDVDMPATAISIDKLGNVIVEDCSTADCGLV